MRIVPPQQSILFAPVTGAVDADFADLGASAVTNGDPWSSVKKSGGAISLVVTPAAALDVDVIAVCHHGIRPAAAIALGGSLATSILTAAYPPDGIALNWFRKLNAPVSLVTLDFDVTGNVDPVIVGELYAGLSFTIDSDLEAGRTFDPGAPDAVTSMSAPFEDGVTSPRSLKGNLYPTDDEYAALVACTQAMRKGTRPVLVIPDDTVNDAWLCTFQWTETMTGGNRTIAIEIVEWPRVRY